MENGKRRLNILLIEDSARRLNLVRGALEEADTRCRLHTVGAGRDAVNYLQRDAPYEDAPKPDLVLFDFSQDNPGHMKLVGQLKNLDELSNMPFALLTRPETEAMLEEIYEPAGDCVMFSPIELADFLKTMNSLRIDRFMNAVALIANLGLVLVRAPDEFVEQELPETAVRQG